MPEYSIADMLAPETSPRPRAKPLDPIQALKLGSPSGGLSPGEFGGASWSVPYALPGEAIPSSPQNPGSLIPLNPGVPAFFEGSPTEDLLARVRHVESGGNDRAVSPVGAQGPFQIMPHTARDPGYGVPPIAPEDVWDPNKSRQWANAYLAAMYRKYNNPVWAVAAYNAGPGTVDRAIASGGFRSLPAETQDYVRKVGIAY